MRILATLLSVAAGVAFGLSGEATAQDALGSGNALDANLGQGSGGRNLPNPALNYQARNLLVTDDVVDGRGFRDTVGYSAARDFRGETGADEFDAFNQLSALSNPQVILSGSTYTQLRYTQAVADLNYLRTYSAPGIDQWMENRAQLGTADMRRTRILVDRLTLGQTLAMQEERQADARVIGTALTSDGEPRIISTSELTGLSVTPPMPAIHNLGLSQYDLARLVQDGTSGMDIRDVGQEVDTTFSNLLVKGNRIEDVTQDSRIEGTQADALIEPVMAGDYEKVLERIAERYAEAENVDLRVERQLLSELDAEFDSLREQLGGDEEPEDHVERPVVGEFERPLSSLDEPEPDEDAEDVNPRMGRTVEDFGIILSHGERIETLTSADDTRFNELMSTAEQKLREGEYFWAERRFEHALRFHPGHPLATAGLGHAQLGAGLYLPAALSLRNMLERQPEMIDVVYDAGLLPNRASLNKSIETLQNRLTGTGRTAEDLASDGFLLAYIGHQIGEPELVDAGLRHMSNALPDDPLVPLLIEIWGNGR